jgi:hypothetical protein
VNRIGERKETEGEVNSHTREKEKRSYAVQQRVEE